MGQNNASESIEKCKILFYANNSRKDRTIFVVEFLILYILSLKPFLIGGKNLGMESVLCNYLCHLIRYYKMYELHVLCTV